MMNTGVFNQFNYYIFRFLVYRLYGTRYPAPGGGKRTRGVYMEGILLWVWPGCCSKVGSNATGASHRALIHAGWCGGMSEEAGRVSGAWPPLRTAMTR